MACFHCKGIMKDLVHLLIKTVTSLAIQEDVIKQAESGEAHQLQKSSEQVAKIDIKDESTLT